MPARAPAIPTAPHRMPFQLSPADQQTLLAVARTTIARYLASEPPADRSDDGSPILDMPCGAFVTLRIDNELRGCIGIVEAVYPLWRTVQDAAISAATRDPRFPALTPAELPQVELEISVLSPPEPVTDLADIVPGTHGLIVRLGAASGLLLPQVATDHDWDRETFLAATCRKAGLELDAWRDPDAVIQSFTATVFHESPAGTAQGR